MFASAALYSGVITTLAGLVLTIKPIALVRIRSRRQALTIVGSGLMLVGVSAMAPTFEARAARHQSRLDEFMPVWQFREYHTRRIAAPAERVFEAINLVTADDILLFRTLTWLRRGGRALPPGILNPDHDAPIIDVATSGGFVRLAEEAPRELVIGTVVAAPRDRRPTVTADLFRQPLPEGFALASMNFVVLPEGPHASIVSTETRVFANHPRVRRRFATYWRAIYPGSALIRRMWLRAIAERAVTGRMGETERVKQGG
jgi:hypothetical protein